MINTALVNKLLAAWVADSALTPLRSSRKAKKMAEIAVAMLESESAWSHQGMTVDPGSGLELPPNAARPYQQRGRDDSGRRLSVEEHIRREYGPYVENNLLFSGHLKEIDRPSYEALLYRARESAKQAGLKRGANTPDFFLSLGILSSEHLNNPPPGLERQAALLNQVRGKQMAAAMAKRYTSTKALDQ